MNKQKKRKSKQLILNAKCETRCGKNLHVLPSIAIFSHFQIKRFFTTSISFTKIISPNYMSDTFLTSPSPLLSLCLRRADLYKFLSEIYTNDVDYVSDIGAWHIPIYIHVLSINNTIHLYTFDCKHFSHWRLNLFPGMGKDQEMKLTVSRESISRCEKAEHSQQVQRRKCKQTTASPHNNPLSLYTRSLHRLFPPPLSNTANTNTEIFRT